MTTPPDQRIDSSATPEVSLLGEISEETITSLLEQLSEAESPEGSITFEICTLGGDAEAARRMVLEIDLARKRLGSRRLIFYGKTTVYSAGITFMSAFPCHDRYLARDTMLLIHCRQLDKSLGLSGPMRGSRAKVQALLHQIDSGVDLEVRNFERLIGGSDITLDEITDRALYNWYLTAEEALERRLVAGVV
jgi:ATP-dependent protease ClpP protease subunit